MKLLVVAAALASAAARLPPLTLRGGSSKWPVTASPAEDAWAKHRSATRSLSGSPKGALRPERLEDVVDAKPLDELLDRDSRVVFTRRVYGLLTANLGLTAACCLYAASNPGLVRSLLAAPAGRAAFGACALVGLLAPLALSFAPALRRDPAKSTLVFATFALCESVVVGAAASAYKVSSVALALAQTGAATGALTAYAFQPNARYDLTAFGSYLLAGLMVLVVSSVAGLAFGMPLNGLIPSTLGAILFSAFIVHDTQLVVGGKKRQLQTSDFALGAMTLYLDIVNLFFYLLRIFGELQGGDD